MKIIISLVFYSLIPAISYAQSGWFIQYQNADYYLPSNCFTDVNTGYFAGARYPVGQGPLVIKTTNAGSNWVEQMTPLRDSLNFYFRSVFFTDINTGYLGAAYAGDPYKGRVLKTGNGGNTWTNSPLPVDKHITTVYFINSSTGYASGLQTILKTTDGSITWSFHNLSVNYLFAIHFTDPNTGYVVGNAGTILKTTDSGANWIFLNSNTTQNLWGLYFADANTGIVVGGDANNTANIILRTTNAGNNWSVIPYSYSACLLWAARFVNPSTGWITGWCGQIIKTTNGGLNWYNQTSPVNDLFRTSFFTSANTGFIGTDYGYILKTTNGGGSFVGINPVINEKPQEFNLFQNYPNPFNPVTKIKFELPESEHTVLKIYDNLGKEITTLTNDKLNQGTYEVEWDAANMPSGVYYYSLQAGEYKETKKMVVVK